MIWGSESWDISCRPQEMCVIKNGSAAGETFESYIKKNPAEVLGTNNANYTRFPLLVKIIDAREQLSVQVHPDDAYARLKGEADSGKSEMWYILTPPKDGRLIIGLKPDITREKLAEAYENGTVENCLNPLHVQAGDIVNIPPGLVHALTPGTVVAEVQQNSDITYRLYDYNRTDPQGNPRQLHVEDALAVSDYEGKIRKTAMPKTNTDVKGANMLTRVISNDFFTISEYIISDPLTEASDPKAFSIFTCVEGSITIESLSMTVEVAPLCSVFIPAMLGSYTIRPRAERAVLLKSSP